MDNATMARLLEQTADLMEIDGADSFRVRSYRRAAEAVEQTTVDLSACCQDSSKLLEIPGIGKSMAANLQALERTGTMPLRDELIARYGTGILELMKLPGMGPKTIALFWSAAQVNTIDLLAAAIDAGKLAELPRMGQKALDKIKKGIEDYRRSSGRFRIDQAQDAAERLTAYLMKFDGRGAGDAGRIAAAGAGDGGGSGPAGDGPACEPEKTGAAVEYVAAYPGIADLIVKGENKVSFHLENGMQVDVRLLPSPSYGAALQYFTGSKAHNVTLRQRALKMGYTLSEWALARLEDETQMVAAATEEEIYAALGMDWIPPEMRENLGEIDAGG